MKITTAIFEAYLRCPTKSYLYSQSVHYTDVGPHQSNEFGAFVRAVSENLRSSVQPDEYYVGTPVLQALSELRYQLILGYTVDCSDIHARIHALQLVPAPDGKCKTYIPVRFIPTVKLTKLDKLLLAFDAIAWFRASGELPQRGRIIHGDPYAVLNVHIPPLVDRVYAAFAEIEAQQINSKPPPLVLNPHCSDCEFQSRCRQLAVEKDDLSLLTNMSSKERTKLNEKGIFTVTQLSYTFRARKAMPIKHYHSLKALAIRKKQIHILGAPSFAVPGTAVYLDVEGNPDRRFYYLIGLRYLPGGSPIQHSFWADDRSQERAIWSSCLNILAQIDKPILIHYGAYETQFLKTMQQRYSDLLPGSYVDQLIASSVNVLSFAYDRVYFPTYSNSLKDVAGYLGFHWSEGIASGRTAMNWRSTWESSRDSDVKKTPDL